MTFQKSIHFIKNKTAILRGGIIHIANPVIKYPAVNYMAINLTLPRSNAWLNGMIIIDKNPFFRLTSNIENRIENKYINNIHFLAVNDRVIYQRSEIFDYTLNIPLNKNKTNIPYAEIFRYY
jgi:predicted RNA methylase